MKNKDNKTNTSNTSNSLMRKTKSQLLDIIFRKDDIEKELRNKNNILEAKLKVLNSNLYNYARDYNILKENNEILRLDYQTICDEYASCKCDINNLNKCLVISRIINIITVIILIIIFTLMIFKINLFAI